MMNPITFCLRRVFCLPLALALMLLSACATTPAPVSYYDFGPTPATSAVGCNVPPIYFADISSPNSLDSNVMLYRLLYDNDQQSHAYANHRWTTTPGQLLMMRIRSQLAGRQVKLMDNGVANPDGWQLRVALIDFAQYFDDATHSYAQLQVRATLLRANNLIAQSTFTQSAPADTPDAPAGARAMRVAADALFNDLSAWLCKQPRP